MEQIIKEFAIKGAPVFGARYGEGHINETFLYTCDSGLSYIVQKINRHVFENPAELMENIAGVTQFLAKKTTDRRASLHVIPTVRGENFLVNADGGCWRVYEFVASSKCLQAPQSAKDLYNVGLAFGQFQQLLAEFPVATLHESIPHFHNTVKRYAQLHEALRSDACGRAAQCQQEIAFALAHEPEAGFIVDRLADGRVPMRVTHNDTKLNNVLLDYDTGEPLCIIDLDTVMPGSALYDYGDAVRFGTSTAAEDERDLSLVHMDLELFHVFTLGYIKGCGGSLTQEELGMLPMGAKLMTLECGIRFLADHLNGDIYFKTHRDGHNLDRARTQLKLVRDMEEKWEQMATIAREANQ